MTDRDLIWAADTVGEVIRRARDAKGLTQRELAKRLKITPMYVSQLETGLRSPSVELCKRLAREFDLDEERLLVILYRARTPEEIQRLLRQNVLTSGQSDNGPKGQLLELINRFPKEAQDYWIKMIIKMLEAALEEVSVKKEVNADGNN